MFLLLEDLLKGILSQRPTLGVKKAFSNYIKRRLQLPLLGNGSLRYTLFSEKGSPLGKREIPLSSVPFLKSILLEKASSRKLPFY